MKHALIVWGGLALHTPREGAATVKALLEAEGFSVTVSEDYAVLGAEDVGRYDLVVPLVTGGELSREAGARLTAAVRAGTGLAGYHMGLATSFRDCVPFRYAAGCYWVAHPGNIIDYRVEITRPDHEITQGIGSFDYRSEQYYLHYDPAIEVLATTTFSGAHDPWRRDVTMPVVYTTDHGAGRVFYSSLGHTADELEIAPVREILRRGLLWAAR